MIQGKQSGNNPPKRSVVNAIYRVISNKLSIFILGFLVSLLLMRHEEFKSLVLYKLVFEKKMPPPPEMKLIKGGDFKMGSESGSNDQRPPHSIQLHSFYIDIMEVTQKEYSRIMEKYHKNIYFKPHWDYRSGDDYPAYYVNWYEAVLFCNARTRETGKADTVYTYDTILGRINENCSLININYDLEKNGYRLPTEAEWEFVGRKIWKVLENKPNFGDYVNYNYNSDSIAQVVNLRVPVNGIYNFYGNMFEWCNDWYDSSYYRNSELKNPQGPSAGTKKVIRGGSIYTDKNQFSPSIRSKGLIPSITWNSDILKPDVGFRCVKNTE